MDPQRYQEDLAYIHHVGFTELVRQATPAILATLRKAGILLKAYRSWQSGPDWACLVDVLPHPDGHALRRAITTFRLVNNAYRRGFEEHWVHFFSRSLLTRQLKEAGFTVQTASAYGRVRLAPGRRLFHCIRARA